MMFQGWSKETTTKAELSYLICTEWIIQISLQTYRPGSETRSLLTRSRWQTSRMTARNFTKQRDDRGMPQRLYSYGRLAYHQQTDRRSHGGDHRRTWQPYQRYLSQPAQQQPQPGRFQPKRFGQVLNPQQPNPESIPLPQQTLLSHTLPEDMDQPCSPSNLTRSQSLNHNRLY